MSTYTARSIYELGNDGFNEGIHIKGTDTSYWISIDVNSSETDTDQGVKYDMDGLEGSKMAFIGLAPPSTETLQITLKGGSYSAGSQGTDGGDVSVTCRSGAVKAPIVTGAFANGTDTDLIEEFIVGPIETARFLDTDGYINVIGGGTGCSATDLDIAIAAIIVG